MARQTGLGATWAVTITEIETTGLKGLSNRNLKTLPRRLTLNKRAISIAYVMQWLCYF